MNMRLSLLGLVLSLAGANGAAGQTSAVGQELTQLSKDKWQWMADKDVGKLEPLFHERAKFVHMGGTWGKTEELDIIKSGTRHEELLYNADELDVVWRLRKMVAQWEQWARRTHVLPWMWKPQYGEASD